MKKSRHFGLRAFVVAGAVTTLLSSAHATLLFPVPTPPEMPLDIQLVTPTGTVVGYNQQIYGSMPAGGFTGIITSYAVARDSVIVRNGETFAMGGLDFYYKLDLTSGADIEEWNFFPVLQGFGGSPLGAYSFQNTAPGADLDASWTLGIHPAAANGGTQLGVATAYDGVVIKSDFTALALDNKLTAANPSSVWQVLHTNATTFGLINASIQDGGVAATHVLGPIPEPSAGLFGVALAGLVGASRRRLVRPATSA